MPVHTVKHIEAFPLAYPEPHYRGVERCVTLVRAESSDGAVGWGEAISQFPEASRATKILVEEGFAPHVIGESPLEVEAAWQRMCKYAYWYGVEGIAAFAISAIDMALWDLRGRIVGEPVAHLIGGPVRKEIPAMGSIIFDMEDLDWTLSEFRSMRNEGYRIVKAGWGMRPDAMFGDDRDRDLKFLAEVRRTIGPEPALVVDTPGARGLWDVQTAIARLREWEPFVLRWVEQPLPPADLDGYARLRKSVRVPVGAGEDEWSPETYAHVIDGGCVDVLQLDPGRCLGITGCRQVVSMCEAADVRYSAHSWSGALNTAASVAFIAMSKNGDTLDFKPHWSPIQHELVVDPWAPADGMLPLREEPGLGVTMREDVVRRYSFN